MPWISRRPKQADDKDKIHRAFTVGEDMFQPHDMVRSSLEREFRALQRGGGGASDSGLADVFRLSVPAFACINYFAKVARTIPLRVDTTAKSDDSFHPFRVFMAQSKYIIEQSTRSLLIWGKVYLRKQYNREGFPTQLEFINPNNIRQVIDHSTREIIEYVVYGHERIPAHDIIYIALFDPQGDGNPLSPLENVFVDAGIKQGIASFAVSFFVNRAMPIGVVSFDPPLSAQEFERVKDQWRRNFRGSGNEHKTGFMSGGFKWTPIQDSNKDLAMSELSDDSKQMICAGIGVPPALVGMGDASDPLSAQNTLQATQRGFIENGAVPMVDDILDELNMQWLHLDFSPPNFYSLVSNAQAMPILSEASGEKVSYSISLLQAGTIDYKQQRAMLNLPEPEENEARLYLAADSTQAQVLYNDGIITLNQALKMVGLPPIFPDLRKVNGVAIPSNKLKQVVEIASPVAIGDIAQEQSPFPQLPTYNPPALLPNISDKIVADNEARSAFHAELAANLAGHSFIKHAKRILADNLQDVDSIQWTDENDWQLPLLQLPPCTTQVIANLMRGVDLMGNTVIDLYSSGYRLINNGVYLSFDNQEPIDRLCSSLEFELRTEHNLDCTRAQLSGVLLCRVNGIDEKRLDIEIESMPVVIDNVGLYVEGELKHTWHINPVTQEMRHELAAWRNKCRLSSRRNKDENIPFEIYYLPQHIVDYVEQAISAEEPDYTAIFAEARKRLEKRAIQSTRIEFEVTVEGLINEALNGNLERRRFTTILKNEIRRFGRLAFRDGLIDGGVLDGVPDEEDEALIRSELDNAVSYVSGLSEQIYKAGIDRATAIGKPSLWFNGAILPLYNAGKISSNGNSMHVFTRVAPTNDKCRDCVRLEGQIHRLKDWARHNLLVPRPGQDTECQGWECGHQLIPTNSRAKGGW